MIEILVSVREFISKEIFQRVGSHSIKRSILEYASQSQGSDKELSRCPEVSIYRKEKLKTVS